MFSLSTVNPFQLSLWAAANAALLQVIGVKMKGRLKGWASPKDVALTLINELADRGAWRGAVIEFFGPGTQNISCTGMVTAFSIMPAFGDTEHLSFRLCVCVWGL